MEKPTKKDGELELIPQEGGALAAPTSMFALLQAAVDKGVPVETMEKLTALYERIADRRAAEEFAGALERFQSECPPIAKRSVANITSQRTGATHSYRYAELDEIANTIRPLLHKHGLSYTWNTVTEKDSLRVTCTLRHVNGHTIESSFQAPADTNASMSAPQKVASTVTYAKRQALIQVLGITTADPDTDGRDAEKVSTEQAATLQSLIEEVGQDPAKFLRFMGARAVGEILACNYSMAVRALEAKRGRA